MEDIKNVGEVAENSNTTAENEVITKGTTLTGEVIHLAVYYNVDKVRSIRRSMRRGHITPWGERIPKRPFNNRKRTVGRRLQVTKEEIYEQLKHARKSA